ncbi:unnamed protein product [Fraxinus pennsylvanica]|uniref:Protein kinase domain-containing protein n=1 Tax=Fraxinus pennsylvanica TaxID=56036 RepID=A0AAD1YY59_9LAMI|nr:unnamed protein product [Fraxinus pennsylvanica]
MIRRQKLNTLPDSVFSLQLAWRRISYRELKEATNTFNESNILGSGSFGLVYGGTLSDRLNDAVEVFNLQLEDARLTRSFATESRVLGSIRHRNLVRIIGCCSNTEFKALIMEYMPNGSPDKCYGILLLEIYMRKKPTDAMFGEEMILKSWVSHSLAENTITKVVDDNLLGKEDENFSRKEQCVSSILALAIKCLHDTPRERINTREVVTRLRKIKATFLAR